jgi:hypothetical protein
MGRPPPPPGRVRTIQRPMYYVSDVLHEAKTRYLEVNKLLYVVLITSKKLRHYFQAHKISVVSSYPPRAVLHNPNVTGNIAKWAAELAEFERDFISHHAIKSQALAGFLVDWTPPANQPGAQTIVSRSPELQSSPGHTGPSSLTAPRVGRGPVRGCCSSLHMGISSSIWCA